MTVQADRLYNIVYGNAHDFTTTVENVVYDLSFWH